MHMLVNKLRQEDPAQLAEMFNGYLKNIVYQGVFTSGSPVGDIASLKKSFYCEEFTNQVCV